ncbi:hypothetical protein E3N88_08668 [Mikania micrantha]|uniref:RIN4 pathogenic type III effector avirulence factor Avr cleavage site domain-containing protein n=1 Tax=Mikania micrantha TaxID=192012 RepID=A0A5N6PHG0_9ASTR|nr:hypothetical protein E3N88_08668 [Mikania micrantha]
MSWPVVTGFLRKFCVKEENGRPLPKFGDWDVNDPASAEGFTVIFNKARDEKKTGKTDSPPNADPGFKHAATPIKKPPGGGIGWEKERGPVGGDVVTYDMRKHEFWEHSNLFFSRNGVAACKHLMPTPDTVVISAHGCSGTGLTQPDYYIGSVCYRASLLNGKRKTSKIADCSSPSGMSSSFKSAIEDL